MPDPRIAHCIFCDDIRYEVGNKLSFVGVYAADIVFGTKPSQEAPAVLSKFAMVLWVISDLDDRPSSMKVTLYGPPGRTEIFSLDPPIGNAPPSSEGAVRFIFQMALPIINLVIVDEGFLELAVVTERGELRAGRLVIRSLPEGQSHDQLIASAFATASPPPSEQSPPASPASKTRRARPRL